MHGSVSYDKFFETRSYLNIFKRYFWNIFPRTFVPEYFIFVLGTFSFVFRIFCLFQKQSLF